MAKMVKHNIELGYYDDKGFFQRSRTVLRVISSKKKLVRYKNERYIIVNPDWNFAIKEREVGAMKKFKTAYNHDFRDI